MEQPVLLTPDLEIPDDIICPITQQIMTDPVMLIESGHTYEREAILKHLQKKKTDPLTNQIIANTMIAPNHTVKKMIISFLDKQKKINPHIIYEIYLPESLTQTLLTAMQKNDQKLFSETLQKDPRLLMNDLKENKNLLILACESATVEILEIILEKLGSSLQTLEAVQSDNGLSLFLMVSRRLGLKSATSMAKALAWKAPEFQALLVLSVRNNEIELTHIALSLGAIPTVDLLNEAYAEKKTEMMKVLLQANFSLIQNENTSKIPEKVPAKGGGLTKQQALGREKPPMPVKEKQPPIPMKEKPAPVKANQGEPPLKKGSEKAQELAIKVPEEKDFLMRTIVDGYSELSLFLLTHGGDELNPNKINYAGQSALHLAIDQKSVDLTVVDALLNHSRINVNQTNRQQESALHIAANHGYLPVVEKLIKKGILLDVKNQEGKTALDIAYSHYDKADFDMLKHLIMAGAKIEDLLLKAIDANQSELIQFFLGEATLFVNPNITDLNGQSALIRAIEKNQLETVSLLLNHPKINNGEVDQQGNTGLHYATMLGNQEIVKLLMKHYLSIKDKNQDEKTPIQLAREYGYAELAKWMEEKHRYKKIKPFLKPLQGKIREQAIEIQKQEKTHQQQIQLLTQENEQLWRKLSQLEENMGKQTTNLDKLSIFSEKYAQSLMTVTEKEQRKQQQQQRQRDIERAIQNSLQTELVAACLKGDLTLVKQLESQGTSFSYPSQEGLYPLVAAVYGCSLETVLYVELKLKNEAEKQWSQVDVNKAKTELDRWTPTELSTNATFGELGNWYLKYQGASWCMYYDTECLKRDGYANWGGWDGSIWELGGDSLWGKGCTRTAAHHTKIGRWPRTGTHANARVGSGTALLSPSVKVHEDVVKIIREQMNTLRREVETKVKLSSVPIFNPKV